MPPRLRRTQILERIQREGGVSVAELARTHEVSAITVHRDLEQLAAEGLVERVHGGARALGPPAPLDPPAIATAWSQRVEQARAAKEAIADRARELVAPGSTMFLDSSSSALALARRLVDDPPNELTLVTSSPAIAYEAQAEPIHVVVAPGELDQHMRMLAGRWTVGVPLPAQLRRGVHLLRGRHAGGGAHHLAAPAGRRDHRGARGRRAHRRADRRDQVRARLAADDRAARRSSMLIVTDAGAAPEEAPRSTGPRACRSRSLSTKEGA